jgi:two-component system OmpR family response regulator
LNEYEIRFSTIPELAEVFTTELVQRRLFVVGADEVSEGEEISLRLVLPETQSVLSALGLVLEHRSDPRGRGADVVLIDVRDDTLALIEQFITERLDASQGEVELAPAARKLDVLIVEDDPIFQEQAAQAFRRAGDQVRFARDGFEALASALRARPDVILSDVNMPRMDGWQLLRMIRGNPKLATVPVVFTTNLASERDRLRGYQLGVDDFVAKPFRPIELRTRAERLVQRRHTIAAPTDSRTTIRGDLSQVTLPSVLSLLELEQRSGAIEVNGPVRGVLWVARGRALRCRLSDRRNAKPSTPMQCAFALLGARSGEFVFTASDAEVDDELSTSITALLMEHARISDESDRDAG